MKTTTNHIESSLNIFKQYKQLGEKAMAQLSAKQLLWKPEPESNSIYLIIKHMSGNMLSRWTDFLTTDGEKEWRTRDAEFEDEEMNGLAEAAIREKVMNVWEEGWNCVFQAMHALTPNDLGSIVLIRKEEHSVLEAINRQVAHYSYHIGQIVFLAKMMRSGDWQSLSIPKNKSKEFNEKMMK
jgi:hypothetical protein